MTKHYKVTVAFVALFLSAFFSASAANTAPKVVFIGDEITYGWASAFAANPNWINKGVLVTAYPQHARDRVIEQLLEIQPGARHECDSARF